MISAPRFTPQRKGNDMRTWKLGLAASCLLLTAACGAGDLTVSPTTPLPQSSEPGRQDYLLNGLHRFKPFDRMPGPGDRVGDSPLLIRVPGLWFDSILGTTDQIVDAKGKTLERFPGSDAATWKTMAAYGLYELDFPLPAALAGKTVLLNVSGCRYLADIYLNGVKLGSQQLYDNNYYNITPLLSKDGKTNLRLALRGFREAPNMHGKPGTTRNTTSAGIAHDLRLIGLEHGTLCRFTALETKVAEKKAFLTISSENYGTAPWEGEFLLTVARDGRALERLAVPATLPRGQSRTRVELPLAKLKLWEPETPELYDVSASFRSKAGVTVASIPSERTGFREVALRGGKLLLNGHVTTLFGDSAPRINILMSQCAGAYVGQVLSAAKSMGFNYCPLSGLLTTQPQTLAAADRLGIMLGVVLECDPLEIYQRHAEFPGLLRLRQGEKISPEEMALFRQQNRSMAEHFALSPAMIAYSGVFGALVADSTLAYQPRLAGRREADANELNRFAERSMNEVAAADPTRFAYILHGGGNGLAYTHNRYWSCGLPLQEKCDFAKPWSESDAPDKMPYFVTEGYMFPGWPSIYPKWGLSPRNPLWVGFKPPFMPREIGAIDQGGAAYFTDRVQTKALLDDHVSNVLRQTAADRYYGVLGHMLHTDMYQACEPGVAVDVKEPLAANVPGFVSRARLWLPPSNELNDLGKALKHAFSGQTFFIMGDASNPTAVEHNFQGGDIVTKNLLVINESGEAGNFVFSVQLRSGDRVHWRQQLDVKLGPGERTMRPLKLVLPEVDQKTRFELEATLTDGPTPGARRSQTFELTAFPRKQWRLSGPGKVAVHANGKELAAILDYYGIKERLELATLKSLDGVSMLVVGRGALDAKFSDLAARLQLGDWLRRGGRMVALEQTGNETLGLALDKRRARNAFIAIPEHPVLAGLDDRDLADWRGKSSLLEEFPAAQPGFHWGEPLVTSTTGIVSSYPVEKPHVGGFLPLLESGYDLQFSPLLELRDGRGALWLCQLDFEGRVGKDPAATLLLGNLLEHAWNWRPTPERQWSYAGDRQGMDFLRELGIELQPLSSGQRLDGACGLVAGPNAGKVVTAAAVADMVKEGGVLVCLPFDQVKDILPVAVAEEKITVDKAFGTRDAANARGLPTSVSDLFWHDKLAFTGWKLPGGATPLLGRIPFGKGEIVYCRVGPDAFKGHYFQMKPYRLWASLSTALGLPFRSQLSATLTRCGANAVVPLGGNAAFRFDTKDVGIKERWMAPGLELSADWKKIVVPGCWETTPYLENFGPPNPPPAAPGQDGVAWYRFEVEVPKSLAGYPLLLRLGKIDDYDTTYFNGVKVGGLGKEFGMRAYAMDRVYRVPEKLVNYGGKNVVAVRVEDVGMGGGIASGPLQLETSTRDGGEGFYLPDLGIMEVFGVSPYYNEQW